jgi:hypothetical protein
LRKTNAVLQNFNKNDIKSSVIGKSALVLHRQSDGQAEHLLCLFNFGDAAVAYTFSDWSSKWVKILDSRQPEWCEDKTPQALLPNDIAAGEEVMLPPVSVTVYTSAKAKT